MLDIAGVELPLVPPLVLLGTVDRNGSPTAAERLHSLQSILYRFSYSGTGGLKSGIKYPEENESK